MTGCMSHDPLVQLVTRSSHLVIQSPVQLLTKNIYQFLRGGVGIAGAGSERTMWYMWSLFMSGHPVPPSSPSSLNVSGVKVCFVSGSRGGPDDVTGATLG